VNAVGESGWSVVWNFITGPAAPSAPILLSPASGAIDQQVSLSLIWNKVSTATSYHVQVATDTNFTSLFTQDTSLTDSLKSISGLANSTVYYWRVRAKNAGGVSNWTSRWSFTTTATGVLPTNPSLPRAFSITGSFGTVRYGLPKQCHVSLKYYDLRGRLAASLINSIQGPGDYMLSVKSALPSSGTYIRVFEAGSFIKREIVAMVGK
jgi:hypothetical protein